MTASPRPSRLALAAALALPLAACGMSPPGDIRPYAALEPMQVPTAQVAAPTAGAIYRDGPTLSLFSDNKARDVGDLLTIELVERTTATTQATTSVDKESTTSMGVGSLFGAPVTVGGQEVLSAEVGGTREFAGAGSSAQSNRLDGSITVTVIQRLPNGNLVVQGQKQVRLNQGNELVQVQGIVRAEDITPNNTVPSSRVAEARIVYGGRGPMARSNVMGWLDRFFNSPAFPY
jgi:flagellar L-ring protein precursor FlgH